MAKSPNKPSSKPKKATKPGSMPKTSIKGKRTPNSLYTKENKREGKLEGKRKGMLEGKLSQSALETLYSTHIAYLTGCIDTIIVIDGLESDHPSS